MRRTAFTCLGFATLAFAPALLGTALSGCSEVPPPGEHVIRAAEPIQGGTVDQADPAVVSILINSSQGMSLCSGSLIGPNLVLSAHHCVATSGSTACASNSFGATYPASDFRVTTSYNAAGLIFNSSNPSFPAADGVTWFGVTSVSVPGNNICGQDMSLLQLSKPVTGVCPLIPAVDSAVTNGEGYTAIGFGITSPSAQTAGTRYKVTGMGVTCASNCSPGQDSATMEWEGGASSAKGTCEGDSGGPAIDAAGRVIGTVSRGPANACNSTVYESVYGEAAWIKQTAQAAATAGGYAAAGWVTGGATSNPANGYCGGTSSSSSSSSSTSTSSSSSSSSSGGGAVPTSCTGADGGIGCCTSTGVLYYCSSANQLTHQTCTGGKVCGWNAAGPYYDCVAAPGGADPSNTHPLLCGGTTSSSSSSSTSSSSTSSSSTSSSSSSGAMSCGLTTGDATCDGCINGSCCAQATACANDASCVTCLGASPPASCNTNQPTIDLSSCLQNSCATQCGLSSSSSSSSSGGASSSGGSSGGTSSGGSTSSGVFGSGGGGTGGGATGTGNNGTGAGHGGLGNSPGTSSGCNVASSGSDPASPASLAGLLLGAALVVSRRRR